MKKQNFSEIAREHYGTSVPEWIEVLAGECDRTSQTQVARKLNRNMAVVSQVLRNKYPGRTDKFEVTVRRTFMPTTIKCPVAGAITDDVCARHATRANNPRVITNSAQIRYARTCPTCEFNPTPLKDRPE